MESDLLMSELNNLGWSEFSKEVDLKMSELNIEDNLRTKLT